eukprot:scaffold4781_cov339-Prasinococcus_capsulatus_cf.AAC.24
MEVLFGNILATVQGEVVRLTVGDQEKYDDPFKQTPDDEEGFCCNLSQGQSQVARRCATGAG